MAGVGITTPSWSSDILTNFAPVNADGGSDQKLLEFRSSDRRFNWVASSPPSVVVGELERQFLEVLQVSTQDLEVETVEWGSKTVIGRSISRWVPSDTIVRELRRAGINGGIEVLCMAHRHYMFTFTDPEAKALALGRPWVVNGQPIAMENWRPEFIPSEESLSSVILWIQLPSLPMEFWSESIVSSILSVAGSFVFIDAATRERKRGAFARAYARVDLRKPLRPGVRVRGNGNPFWYHFVYEHLEAICSACGSVHLEGNCGVISASDSSPSSLIYGPWMAALRHRRSPQSQSSDDARNLRKSSALPSASSAGWQVPKKPARRSVAKEGVTGVDTSSTGVVFSKVGGSSMALDWSKGSGVAGSPGSLNDQTEGVLACRSSTTNRHQASMMDNSLVSVPLKARWRGGFRSPLLFSMALWIQ